MIEISKTAAAFEALGHEVRLAILRLLIPAGPDGVPAGAIARALAMPANRLSFHLNRLAGAGLVECRRQGRHLFYAVRYAVLGDIVGFLVEDCCAAAPSGCLPECPGMPARGTAASGCGSGRRPPDRPLDTGG